jgi:hypothetical protein
MESLQTYVRRTIRLPVFALARHGGQGYAEASDKGRGMTSRRSQGRLLHWIHIQGIRRSRMKRLIKTATVLAVMLGLSSHLRAAVSDSLTITITPNAFYAVVIDTANVSLDLGTVALAASTQTVSPSTVSIQSTYATTDLKLQGAITSGGTAWTFDSDTSDLEQDALAAWATFTSVARSSAPSQTGDYFSGTVPGAAASDAIDANSRYVGSSVGNGTTDLFENNSDFDSKNMDGMAPEPDPAGTSHLWLRFRLPDTTTTNTAQNITITLTAVAPN